VPKDENLEITFSQNRQCVNFSTSKNLGTFSDNTTLDNMMITLEDVYTISGRLLSCEGEASKSGYTIISSDEGVIIGYANEDGFFNTPVCFSNFILLSVDFDSGFKSESINFVSEIQEDTDIGEVLLCSENDTYFIINYENEMYKNEGASGRLYGMQNLSLGSDSSIYINHYFHFSIDVSLNNGEIIGKHKSNYTSCGFSDKDENNINLACNRNDPIESCDISVEIITAEPFGGHITGSFEGTLINRATNETAVPVSGSFKVLSFL